MANILIADDEKSVLSYFSFLVMNLNHTSFEAEDGEKAYQIFQDEEIDLSIIDINMPKMDGLTFLKKIKDEDPNAVVIIMTGHPSAETIVETIEDDGYTYITKPFNLEKCVDLIQRGLAFRKKLVGEKSADIN